MSIADHFEQAADSSFVRDYDATTARRQFNFSLVLIVVIALAASALGAVVRFDSPAPQTSAASASLPAYAGRL